MVDFYVLLACDVTLSHVSVGSPYLDFLLDRTVATLRKCLYEASFALASLCSSYCSTPGYCIRARQVKGLVHLLATCYTCI